MWDYNKLFAEGNVVGIKIPLISMFSIHVVCAKNRWGIDNNKNWKIFCNNELKAGDCIIQYIIRLDEHGNVVEKLFDREKDMKKPMPELETGMFVRVGEHKDNVLGFIDAENNHIIYQDGDYDFINSEDIWDGVASEIIEVYGKDTLGFSYCRNDEVIWRSPEYQDYLDSKN